MLKNIFIDISTCLSSIEDFKINFNIEVFFKINRFICK